MESGLKKLGLKPGEYVEVVCGGDKSTVTKNDAPVAKKSLEDIIKNLSERQKKKLSEMIDKL